MEEQGEICRTCRFGLTSGIFNIDRCIDCDRPTGRYHYQKIDDIVSEQDTAEVVEEMIEIPITKIEVEPIVVKKTRGRRKQ